MTTDVERRSVDVERGRRKRRRALVGQSAIIITTITIHIIHIVIIFTETGSPSRRWATDARCPPVNTTSFKRINSRQRRVRVNPISRLHYYGEWHAPIHWHSDFPTKQVPASLLPQVQVQVQVFIDTLAAQRPNNLIKRESLKTCKQHNS